LNRNLSAKTIKFIIDGKEVLAAENDTILKVAKENSIYIPTLCFMEGLSTMGGCRLCLVEIKGSSKLFPACTTPVANGLYVITSSDKLTNYRKMLVELILSERTHICAVCVANGSCELQDLAKMLGVEHVRFNREWTAHEVDCSHERFAIDRNRCIVCTRCVRVCDEIEGVHTLDLKNRGKDSQVIMDLDETWGNSPSCTSCQKCSVVCPVGAIYIRGKPLEDVKDKDFSAFVMERRKR
jgi:bidirectional [NiFe] hydrogenase diaphorase subunit